MVEQLSAQVKRRHRGAAEGREDTLRLHEISTLLIQESNLNSLYERILDAAIGLMSSDMASMQIFHPERSALQLLAWRGFHPESATFWEWVHLDSASTCGLAFSAGSRVVVPDVETCDFMAGTTDLDEYRRSNIRAVQSTPLVSRSGQLLGMISTHWCEPHQPTEFVLHRLDVLVRQASDLIERGKVEATLRESEQQFRWFASIIESSDDAIISTNLDGLITSWNKGAERIFSCTAEEAVGKPITILIPPDRQEEEAGILERIRRGEYIDHYETVCRRKHGDLVVISLTVSPIKNAEGKIIGASKTARDITERKRSEHDRWLLASIVESSDDAIVSKDLNGIITSWNKGAQRLFGYMAEEAVGKSITILIPSDRLDEETTILELIRRGKRIEHYETVRRRRDGSLVEISLTVSPIKNAEGRIMGASKIARDITERRRAEEQQNLLLREMSHRIKNLFAVASGVVTLSARSADTPEEMAKAIRDRLGALSRAYELTRPGLIDPGQTFNRDTTLEALVRTIFSPYVDCSGDSGRVMVDGPEVPLGGGAVTSLALLLHEFATNAAKYGALAFPSGRVRVHWIVEKDELALTWQERGGSPVVGQPDYEGFGSMLVRRIVNGQFDGRLSRDWQSEGLTIHLLVPIQQLTK